MYHLGINFVVLVIVDMHFHALLKRNYNLINIAKVIMPLSFLTYTFCYKIGHDGLECLKVFFSSSMKMHSYSNTDNIIHSQMKHNICRAY